MNLIIRALALTFTWLGLTVVVWGNNTTQQSNIADAGVYITNSKDSIEGWADFTWDPEAGMWVTVSFWKGVTGTNTNYAYSINNKYINSQGNCDSGGPILNPLRVDTTIDCDNTKPETCAEGDLSGKHGTLKGSAGGNINPPAYAEWEIRFWRESFSILGRSFVLYDGDSGMRLACGNITSTMDGTADEGGNPTNVASTYQNDYATSTLGPVKKPNPYPCVQNASDISLGQDGNGNPEAVPNTPSFVYKKGVKLPTQGSSGSGPFDDGSDDDGSDDGGSNGGTNSTSTHNDTSTNNTSTGNHTSTSSTVSLSSVSISATTTLNSTSTSSTSNPASGAQRNMVVKGVLYLSSILIGLALLMT